MPEGATSQAAIALGSNLGDRERNLNTAISRVASLGEVTAVSSFRDTAPVGFLDQPRFLNAALLLRTRLAPDELMRALLEIERAMGRNRINVPAKGPRLIDLDLLFYSEVVVTTPELTLPHPAMHERVFVLEPLQEIAPGWKHPRSRKTVEAMLASLSAEG